MNIALPYKQDEVLSAFHKCIRKGDVPLSCYFAKCVSELYGIWKIKQYIFLTIFEETTNLELYKMAKELYKKEDSKTTDMDIYKVVSAFANTEKKWENETGRKIYELHIKNITKCREDILNETKVLSIKNYTRFKYWEDELKKEEVCFNKKSKTFKKTGLYAPPILFTLLDEAIEKKDIDRLIYLSILFFYSKEKLPFNKLKEYCNNPYSLELFEGMNEYNGKRCYYYNYILLFYSFINEVNQGTIKDYPIDKLENIEKRLNKALIERRFVPIPLYAYDNHTGKGKQLMSKINVDFNIPLEGIDLTYSGNWHGVIWRINSMKQFNTVEKKWEEVKVELYWNELIHKYMEATEKFNEEDKKEE